MTDNRPLELIAEVKRMHAAHISQAHIAEELGISESTVQRYLNDGAPVVRERVSTVGAISPTPLDDVRAAQIVARYVGGETVTAICDDEGISTDVLYGALSDAGVPARTAQVSMTRELRLREAIDMYERGEKMHKIQAATGMTPTTFYRRYRAIGGKTRRG